MEPSERPMKCWGWARFASEVKLLKPTIQLDDVAPKADSDDESAEPVPLIHWSADPSWKYGTCNQDCH